MGRVAHDPIATAVWAGIAVGVVYLSHTDASMGLAAVGVAGVAWYGLRRSRTRPWERWDGAPPPRPAAVASSSDGSPSWLLVVMTTFAGATAVLFVVALILIIGIPMMVLLVGPLVSTIATSAAAVVLGAGILAAGVVRLMAEGRPFTSPRATAVREPDRVGVVRSRWGWWRRGLEVQWWPLDEIDGVRVRASWRGPYHEVAVRDVTGRRQRWRAGLFGHDAVREQCGAMLGGVVPRLVERLRRGEAIAIGRRWGWPALAGGLLAGDGVWSLAASGGPLGARRVLLVVTGVASLVLLVQAAIAWLRGGVVLSRTGIRSFDGRCELAWHEVLGVHWEPDVFEVRTETRRLRVDAGAENAHALPRLVEAMNGPPTVLTLVRDPLDGSP